MFRFLCSMVGIVFLATNSFANTTFSSVNHRGVPIDKILAEIMNLRNGVYIEAGANNGLEQSNTRLLELKYGWTGILIEPSENLFPILCANRPNSICYQCALGSFEENDTFVYGDFNGSLMSSVGGVRCNQPATQKVPMRSLQSILDETGLHHINFFSLDTEGYELNVLKGIDFNKTKFDFLLIEIYPAEKAEIISLLDANGYDLFVCVSGYNKVSNPGWDGTHNDYLFVRRQ